MTNILSFIKNKLVVKIILFVIALTFLILFSGTRKSVDESFENVFALTRGQLQPDTNIVLIDITSSDIDNLGNWPLKRSYYALLINSLTKYNVKKIGLEVFLSAKFVTQTLYDNLVTKEIESSGRVILSSVAGNVYQDNNQFYTDSLSYPSPKLIDENIKTGHLNYFGNNGIEIPLVIHSDHSTVKAFALQLAGDNFKNTNGTIKINFISSWKKFKRYSLLQYFELVNENNPLLKNLKDKIIIIGVSDPQVSSTIKTAFDNSMPDFALHAFALDNLLENRALNNNFIFPSELFFAIVLLVFLFIGWRKADYNSFRSYLILSISTLVFAFVLFSYLHIELSYSFFIIPFLLFAFTDFIFFLSEKEDQLKGVLDEAVLLKNLLNKKELELGRLQKELDLSGDGSSSSIVEKIKTLKNDIEKLKENKSDSIESEEPFNGETKEFYDIVYKSKAMSKVIEIIKKAAPEDASVLILGESGTGKELAAKAIHQLSKRNKNNFVAVNCGALSDTLLESELFGHVKGAFTGAVADKIGRFEAANNGTIFLDEIAETTENFQVKLLRVIQAGDFEKVGSSKTQHTDVRIVAATNRHVDNLVKEKKFREDLYYRLNVIKIELPPLKDRKEDILILANYFLKKENSDIKLSEAASEAMLKYEWKGNVRELEAVIKRAVIFAKSSGRNLIQLADLPEEIVRDSKFNFEDIVVESLRSKKFSRSSIIETAKELGNVSRNVVSENFRGYSLKTFVEYDFDFDAAVKIISDSEETEVIDRVKNKLQTFLSNIQNDIRKETSKDFEVIKNNFISKYKNLPHKFHYYLDEVIQKELEKLAKEAHNSLQNKS